MSAAAVDESAKIDVNAASETLLKSLLQNLGGQDAESAQRLVEAIADWKDADDLRRPNGAEGADYLRGRPQDRTRRTRRSKPSATCSACWECRRRCSRGSPTR